MNVVEEKIPENFTKYEIARILGARALQIAMDAPLLLKIPKTRLEEVRYDPLKIAEIEFNGKVLPITVKRPFPKKSKSELKREKEVAEKTDKIEKIEKEEQKEIEESGEIMELVKPEDEAEEELGEIAQKKEEAI